MKKGGDNLVINWTCGCYVYMRGEEDGRGEGLSFLVLEEKMN